MIELILWTVGGFSVVRTFFWVYRRINGANEMSKIRSDLSSFVEASDKINSLFPPQYVLTIPTISDHAVVPSSPKTGGSDWIMKTEPHVRTVRGRLQFRIKIAAEAAPLFKEALEYTQKKSGKMIRSRLIFLLGDALALESESMILLSQVVELEHCASLLHDDVVDDADTRRGVESHRKVFGDRIAVLTGDNLISILVDVLAEIGNMRVTECVSESIQALVVGELLQLVSKQDSFNYTDAHKAIFFPFHVCGDLSLNPEILNRMYLYIRKSYFKTASLFATLSESCGILSLKECEKSSKSLASFGFFFGLAFQIIDDILDVEDLSEEGSAEVGKPVGGSDIRNGTVTLPVLFACVQKANLTDSERSEMLKMVKRRFSLGGDPERTLQLLVKSDAIQMCRKIVNHYLNRCRSDLRTIFRNNKPLPALEQLLIESFPFSKLMASEWVGTAQSQNTKDRMEDEVIARTWKGGGLFAVLDGHNGRLAVEFAALHLPDYILDTESYRTKKFLEALLLGIARTESELLLLLKKDASSVPLSLQENDTDLDFPLLTSGVVVCIVLIEGEDIFTANVGDCRAVLSRRNAAIQITSDHNILDPIEKERVKAFISSEGFVRGLMVTRSLGNIKVGSLEKCEGQIAEPALSHFPIGDSDEFLLIASDGLYEVVSNDVAISSIHRAMKRPSFSPENAAQELVDRALARGSCDNICVCVVMLKRPRYS